MSRMWSRIYVEVEIVQIENIPTVRFSTCAFCIRIIFDEFLVIIICVIIIVLYVPTYMFSLGSIIYLL